ncbi:MAG: heme o synthase [Pseudomonadota bacterium]
MAKTFSSTTKFTLVANKPSLFASYLELCKPRVVALMLLTSMVGMLLASEQAISLTTMFLATLGIGLCASSGAAINHIADQHLDAIMARTKKRPLPCGKLTNLHAISFALALLAAGMFVLFTFVNGLTAWLTFLTFVGYAGIYTLFLKRATPQNIVIGGLAGAMPPLLGWVAITGNISAFPLLLVLIIFIWTPPHFWALAIFRYQDYRNAEIPMLPVIYGIKYTKLNILFYSILLLLISVLPYLCNMTGLIYLLGSLVLNGRFLWLAMRTFFASDNKFAIQLFRYSIIYLMLLFILLLIDHYVMLGGF